MKSLSVATPAKPAAKPVRLSYNEQRELDSMESTILDAETLVQELETTLNDPAFYAAHAAEAPVLTEKLTEAKREVARLYERWEELAGRI